MKPTKKVKKPTKKGRLELAREFLFLTQQLINICDIHGLVYKDGSAMSDFIEEELEEAFIKQLALSSSDLDEISKSSYSV